MRVGTSTAAVGAVVLVAGLLAPPVHAVSQTAACSTSDAGFCFSYGASITSPGTQAPQTDAAASFDLSLAFADTSPSHSGDKTRWLDEIGVDVASSPTQEPLITPSSDLPDGLLIAGSAADCAPGGDNTFSGCAAGHGAALADVSGSGGLFDGVHTATVGVQRITNVQTSVALARYDVRYTVCVPTPFGACAFPVNGDLDLEVPTPSGGPGTRTFTMSASGSASFAFPGGTATVDYALDSLSLNLHGSSGQLATGDPADRTYDVLRLPRTCGQVSADGSATSRAAATVSVPLVASVVGCPTVSTTGAKGVGAHAASFTASAASPLGRSVTGFLWTFGDGTSSTTSSGRVRHTYRNSASRVVQVVAIDSAGARSSAKAISLTGSSISLKAPKHALAGTKVRFKGRLKSAGRALARGKVVLHRCNAKGKHCKALHAAKSARNGSFAFHIKMSKTAVFQVEYAGARGRLGAQAAKKVKVKRR